MMSPQHHDMSRATIIAFAAGLAGLMPFAMDVYLIMMPRVADFFGASLPAVHRTMAGFSIGFGIAHLFVGVLADRYGRRPIALAGVLLFILASFAVTFATNLEMLGIARFFQGLAVASGPILARAIIRDVFPAARAASAFAITNGLTGVAPLVAPFIAAAIAGWAGWRGAMGLLLIYALVLWVALLARLPETLVAPREDGAGEPRHRVASSPFAAIGKILTNRAFLLGSGAATIHFSALFTFLTTSPFLMISTLGFSEAGTATVLGLASGGYIVGSFLAARLARRHAPEVVLGWGTWLMVLGSFAVLVALTRSAPHPLIVLACVWPFYIGLGFSHANAIQIAMRPFGQLAGQASAWLGLFQQIGGVVIATIAVELGAGYAAIGVMIGCSVILMILAMTLLPRISDADQRA